MDKTLILKDTLSDDSLTISLLENGRVYLKAISPWIHESSLTIYLSKERVQTLLEFLNENLKGTP